MNRVKSQLMEPDPWNGWRQLHRDQRICFSFVERGMRLCFKVISIKDTNNSEFKGLHKHSRKNLLIYRFIPSSSANLHTFILCTGWVEPFRHFIYKKREREYTKTQQFSTYCTFLMCNRKVETKEKVYIC